MWGGGACVCITSLACCYYLFQSNSFGERAFCLEKQEGGGE